MNEPVTHSSVTFQKSVESEGTAAGGFRIPPEAHIGHVHLRISDLNSALHFYQEVLGFRVVSQKAGTVALSATGGVPLHIVLTEVAGARRKPPRTTGLYHVAIRYPSRRALARTFRRLVEQKWPFQGAADHLVSEALYLADANGNGLELYVDRPRESWRRQNGQIAMALTEGVFTAMNTVNGEAFEVSPSSPMLMLDQEGT